MFFWYLRWAFLTTLSISLSLFVSDGARLVRGPVRGVGLERADLPAQLLGPRVTVRLGGTYLQLNFATFFAKFAIFGGLVLGCHPWSNEALQGLLHHLHHALEALRAGDRHR